MKRPSKKEIKEALEKLRKPPVKDGIEPDLSKPKLEDKKSSQRIRKQGI